jgi:hypothetical protein
MGITSNDIAAQRAMIERGEEKRKADWKQAERERLRDTFAAAALTGMMSRVSGKAEAFAEAAYKLADAMLRERNRAVAGCETATLTDEEREAIEGAISVMPTPDVYHLSLPAKSIADTLRNLL